MASPTLSLTLDAQNTGSSNDPPTNEALVTFKSHVRQWLEIDEQTKKIQLVLRERTAAKKELTAHIVDFMARYNIEDLSTAAGKIRYKIAVVKEPLSQQNIKDRVTEYFSATNDPSELNKHIFSERKTMTKPTLRRLAITGGSSNTQRRGATS
jgi:hypothetical protein